MRDLTEPGMRFKAGTVHIRIEKPEHVARINAMLADGSLPQDRKAA